MKRTYKKTYHDFLFDNPHRRIYYAVLTSIEFKEIDNGRFIVTAINEDAEKIRITFSNKDRDVIPYLKVGLIIPYYKNYSYYYYDIEPDYKEAKMDEEEMSNLLRCFLFTKGIEDKPFQYTYYPYFDLINNFDKLEDEEKYLYFNTFIKA